VYVVRDTKSRKHSCLASKELHFGVWLPWAPMGSYGLPWAPMGSRGRPCPWTPTPLVRFSSAVVPLAIFVSGSLARRLPWQFLFRRFPNAAVPWQFWDFVAWRGGSELGEAHRDSWIFVIYQGWMHHRTAPSRHIAYLSNSIALPRPLFDPIQDSVSSNHAPPLGHAAPPGKPPVPVPWEA